MKGKRLLFDIIDVNKRTRVKSYETRNWKNPISLA
jgi:hypothetical protein